MCSKINYAVAKLVIRLASTNDDLDKTAGIVDRMYYNERMITKEHYECLMFGIAEKRRQLHWK